MRREQSLHHGVGAAEARGIADEAVGIDARRRAADAVETEHRSPRSGRSRRSTRTAAAPDPRRRICGSRSPAAPYRARGMSGLSRNGRHVRSNSRSGRRRSVRISRRTPRKHHGQTRSWTISMPRRAFGGARMFTARFWRAMVRLSRDYHHAATRAVRCRNGSSCSDGLCIPTAWSSGVRRTVATGASGSNV